MGKQVGQSEVARKIRAFELKWRKAEKTCKDIDLLLWSITSTKQDWESWAEGRSRPSELFKTKDHPYVGWSKKQFEELYKAANKLIEEFKSKH